MPNTDLVLTGNKIKLAIELVQQALTMHSKSKVYEADLNYGNRISNSSIDLINDSVIIKSEDDWFILAIHRWNYSYAKRRVCAHVNNTTREGFDQYFEINASYEDYKLYDYDTKEDINLLSKIDDFDSVLFQLQTLYTDNIILTIMVQYYTCDIFGEDRQIVVNCNKIIDLNENEMSEMITRLKKL